MGIFSQFLGKNRKARSRPAGLRAKPVRFEALERREVLSVSVPYGGNAVVEYDAGDIDVYVNGAWDSSYDEDSGATITLNCSTGTETVTVRNLGAVFDGSVVVNGSSGNDILYLYDSSSNDSFVANAATDTTTMTNSNYSVTVNDFAVQHLYASGGTDDVQLRGTTGADDAISRPEDGINWLLSDGSNPDYYYFRAKNFEVTNIYGVSGYDVADMRDTSGDDRFVMDPDEDSAVLWLDDDPFDRVRVKHFDVTNMAFIEGGNDFIEFEGTAGNDDAHLDGTIAQLWGGGYYYLSGLSGSGYNADELNIIGEGGTNRLDQDSPVYAVDPDDIWIVSDWYD